MSSFRKAAPRRTHKERSQLHHREHLGLLEKKKDYQLRAKDFYKKKEILKKLQEKAQFKNEDEFYHKMISTGTKKGVHIESRKELLDDQTVLLMKSQDKNYIKYHADRNKSKIQKLRDNMHIVEGKNNHTIFVDDMKSYDPSTRTALDKPLIVSKHDKETLEELRRQKARDKRELETRLERDAKLRKAELELEIQRNLMAKGSKKKVGVDSMGLPIYKWAARRSK